MENVSRKQFKKAVLPEMGTVIDEKYKVRWVHFGQFRFTADYLGDPPEVGHLLEWQGKHYLITLLMPENRMSATFYGFVKNPIAELNEEESAAEFEDVSTASDMTTCVPPVLITSEEEELPSCFRSDKPCECVT
jgi:hypothetical protein